ncbi:serine/threonine-protein kinase [Actinomycetospora succinea]|uniref:non-specific serine/threonine protein kinase n=1 Tax=Actinomycetospora succinea TaxID=663603 RepID=A0A4R6V997_9PSEU|nr:protein kinase [Actinomycetospora succinea]TDQ58326.1 serine/threonine-protein kinase [Actinomycetospora succinea]
MSTEAPGQTPPSSGEPAETFGPYRLEERIGRGGMGEVFRAFDTSRQRTVAVKRLHGGLADDGDYQERFRRESRTAARLSSPHVIPIHDFGTIDGRLYIDMRLVSGVDLAEEIERGGRLEPRRAVEIVRQTADALDAAHDDGLIHRDVKPSNVLLTQHRGRDFVYLVDFGIVRAMGGDTKSSLTGTGSAIGTLAYMAPELFVGREMDRRVDVYALGCLLFEAIAGRPPFVSEGPGLMYDHLNETPPRLSEVAPGSPPALDAVLAQAMAKDPAQRFATAGDFADAAVRAVGGEPGVSGTAPVGSPDDATARNVAAGAGAFGAGAVAGAAAAGAGSSGPQSATPTQVPGPRQASGPQQSQPWTPQAPQGPSPFGAPQGSGPQPAPAAWGPTQPGGTQGYGQPGYPGTAPQGYGPTGPGYGTGQYPPPPGSGPQGWYGQPPPPKGGKGKVVAIIAGVAVLLLVVVVGAVVLLNQNTSTPAAPPVTTPTQTPDNTGGGGTPGGNGTSAPAGQATMAQVFPDVTASTCRPTTSQDRLTTSTGVNPTEAYVCDFSSAAPGARVIFARWPDAAGAQAWYQDTANLGPRIENFDVWRAGGVEQGPLYTAERDGTVYSTGIYSGLNYSWEIRTSTLDQSNAVFQRVQFRAKSTFGG